jgi:membrane protease YdiL (CAAX protease family)
MGKECCPIPPPPNDEREERQRAANSKREVLDGAFQNKKERRENATRLKCETRRTLIESDATAEYIVTLLSTTDLPNQPSLKARGLAWRLLSASEVLLGAAIVIGHNVFGMVPNEVPILFVLGLVSVRVRDGGWSAIGFRRPESWLRLILIALAAAALRIALGDFVIEPLAAHWWPPIHAPAGTEHIAGNIKIALLWLLIIWTFAAFGEEVSYRGYLTLRAADVGGRSTAAFWVATLLVSVLFGYGHYYKGPTGIVDSSVAGFILGSAYLLTGRNLWAPVLAHGVIDTVGVIVGFFGWEE